MSIAVKEHVVRTAVVTLTERLDAFNAPDVRERLYALLDEGVTRFVLDLRDVPFMDSAGMAVIVSLLKRAREKGGDVKLVWPHHEAARRILHLTKFDRVFDIAETPEEALQRF
ncbi:MAG: anti-sigma factor antagonist [Ardenticatenia bacterium]|nr:MAG: anti-sigma factor antagonist [Ardenticatenia bacterium]